MKRLTKAEISQIQTSVHSVIFLLLTCQKRIDLEPIVNEADKGKARPTKLSGYWVGDNMIRVDIKLL